MRLRNNIRQSVARSSIKLSRKGQNPGVETYPSFIKTDLVGYYGTNIIEENAIRYLYAKYPSNSLPTTGLIVVSGTEFPNLVVKAPNTVDFQSVPEFAGQAEVNLATFTDTAKVRVGTKGIAIYTTSQSEENLVKIDVIVNNYVAGWIDEFGSAWTDEGNSTWSEA